MTTPKNLVVPGTIVKVTNRKPTPPPAGSCISLNLTTVVLSRKPGDTLQGATCPPVGSVLEILSKPKLFTGINCVKVKYSGEEFYTYYQSIRYDTTPV